MKKYRLILCVVLLSLCSSVFSWNAAGHKVIALIAFDHLTPTAKKQVNKILAARFHSRYPNGLFLKAATWPDRIKGHTKVYNTWHYINLPIMEDGFKKVPTQTPNVVWAIGYAEKKVVDTTLSNKTRAKYLSFLIHFVGDIHQPLHAATLYSRQFPPPRGDLGGNRFRIKSRIAKNLHQYWDRGLGLFYSKRKRNYLSYYTLLNRANAWMAEFSVSRFASRLKNKWPETWAQTSFSLAKKYAYDLPVNAKPSHAYNAAGRKVVKEQVVLAGYRLADILNAMFAGKDT